MRTKSGPFPFNIAIAIVVVSFLSILDVGTAFAGVPPPPNSPAQVDWDGGKGTLRLSYRGEALLEAEVLVKGPAGERPAGPGDVEMQPSRISGDQVESRIKLAASGSVEDGTELRLRGTVTASDEAFPAETLSPAQERFPCVRTVSGLSRSQRNNAIYDRRWDWMLEGPAEGRTRIVPWPAKAGEGRTSFSWESRGAEVVLTFRPLYYSRHRKLRWFEPWNQPVRKDSIAGWCSWWAYRADFNAKDLGEVLAVMKEKRLDEFGYRFIQIDDAYQGGSGTPESWLKWNDKFPGGMAGYAGAVRAAGFEPAIWVGAFFKDEATVRAHPEWFVRGPDGKPTRGPWVDFGIDATVPAAADALVRPTYRGIRENRFTYVKIDALRHLLFDSIHRSPEYGRDRGLSGDEIFRRYLEVAREELGPDPFVLACWGAHPEAIGLADGCRLGTDGFGPATLQQYNSWNGVVWRNDPDHCDVLGGSGTAADSILRPTVVSLAGAMLLLSDRAEVYRKDENLEGIKRSAPILFTVPGQLYDVEPERSSWLLTHDRGEIRDGGPPSPMDARQSGKECPWWLLEVDRPFGSWMVLARYNWTGAALPEAEVRFADIGLPPYGGYLAFEFWTKRFLGVLHGGFKAEGQPPVSVRMYAIRRALLDRPQVLSTSRHISQGGVDLQEVTWDAPARTLRGRSAVVRGDPYVLSIHAPEGYRVRSASFDGEAAETRQEGPVVTAGRTPARTGTVSWEVVFER